MYSALSPPQYHTAPGVCSQCVCVCVCVCFHCSVCALGISDGEEKRSGPVKLSTQLYQKKVHYSKLVKTVHAVAI